MLKNRFLYFFFSLTILVLFAACKNETPPQENADTAAGGVADQWKLGVALWTFHTFPFPEALAKVDSSGLEYIEAAAFLAAGPEFNDTMIAQLSPAGIEKVKAMISEKGLKLESIYASGDELAAWQKQFEIGKQLGVKFITGEPPVKLWDEIDSLAGAYQLKVAIHDHWKGVSAYWHPDSVLAAIAGHPNFGACADVGHWPKSGVDPVEGIKKLDGHIIALHLKDIAAFDNPELKDVPVGTGVIDFPGIFAELKRQGFTGHIYIERDAQDLPSNLPSVLQTIDYYEAQVAKLE